MWKSLIHLFLLFLFLLFFSLTFFVMFIDRSDGLPNKSHLTEKKGWEREKELLHVTKSGEIWKEKQVVKRNKIVFNFNKKRYSFLLKYFQAERLTCIDIENCNPQRSRDSKMFIYLWQVICSRRKKFLILEVRDP